LPLRLSAHYLENIEPSGFIFRRAKLEDWIRIRIGSGSNDLCGSGSGSMGKKNEEKNSLFLNFLNILIAKR
jgi:hypothetical protein